jgi:hypothetical protein
MKSAEQTLAASIASSISLCASLRTRGTICSMRPFSSQMICVSVVSKSTAPRCVARLQQRAVHVVQVQEVRHQVLAARASGPRVFARIAATSV